jgi:hypothetical protein
MFLTIGYWDAHLILGPRNHVKGTIISLILKYSMTGCGADLPITEVAALASSNFRDRSYQFMNIRIILLILESIVTGHMFDLDGLR